MIFGWLLVVGGVLLGLVALAAAAFSIFMTGGIWLGGGKFTEGLGGLLIGVVVVGIALLLGALAVVSGLFIIFATAN